MDTSGSSSTSLLLSEIFPPRHGGSGRWLYQIYRRLPASSAIAVVDDLPAGASPSAVGGEAWIHRVPFKLADTGGLSPRGALGYLRLLRRIRSATSGTQLSAVHAARVLPEGWLAYLNQLRSGVPYLCFAHGEEINLDGSRDGGVMSSRQHRWMARPVFHHAQRVIANSHNTAAMLRDQWGLPDDKIAVMNPGVDGSFFVPRPHDADIRQQLGWGDAPVLLSVGRLQRRKGHDRVLEALPLIRQQVPGLLYAIVGDGEERQRLTQLADEFGVADAVRWYPDCSDTQMLQIYQQCDLFILANRQVGSDVEGFGMVLLEAAACAKATITGSSGGTDEAVVDGETGRVIDAADPAAIATAVVDLMANEQLRITMGKAGRDRVESQFDWTVLAAQAPAVLGF